MSFSDRLQLSEAFSISRDGIIACDGPALSCSVELLLSAKLTTLAKLLAVPPARLSVPWGQPCCCCTIWFPPASKHHSKSWLNQPYDRLCCGAATIKGRIVKNNQVSTLSCFILCCAKCKEYSWSLPFTCTFACWRQCHPLATKMPHSDWFPPLQV